MAPLAHYDMRETNLVLKIWHPHVAWLKSDILALRT